MTNASGSHVVPPAPDKTPNRSDSQLRGWIILTIAFACAVGAVVVGLFVWFSPEEPPAPVQTPQEMTYQNDLQTGINTGVQSIRDIVVSAGPLTPSDRQRLTILVAQRLTEVEKDYSDANFRPAVAAIVTDPAAQFRVITITYAHWNTFRGQNATAADARTALRNSTPGLDLSGPLPLSPAFRVNVGCISSGNEAAVMLDNVMLKEVVLANTTGQDMSNVLAGCNMIAPFFGEPRLN